ncbi:MAG: hypothetical protein FWG27_07950 [Treponema sp.]|jgi:chromosome segregation ATPase|nr:hypothetical protein [Treponema sp.]
MNALFTAGNLITLAISILAIVMVRYMDRQNRSVDLAREYGKRLKEDIAAFAEEKAGEVKDQAIILDVQKSAVKEALNRLTEANAGLAKETGVIMQRLEEVGRIGERISAYDKSMAELIRMSGRVEENMGRLREESALMETTAKKISELKVLSEKLERDMSTLELRFERENTAALEKTTEALIAQVESSVDDLRSETGRVERQVEEHRAAVDRIETDRKLSLERDIGIINKVLGEATERAETRAGKLEEEALVKYREESLARIHHFQETVEEKFREYHENAKTRISEIQTLVHSCKNEWKNDHAQLETRQRDFHEQLSAEQREYRETWQRDLEALDALALSQRKQWENAAAKTEAHLIELGQELDAKTSEAEERILKEIEGRLAEYRNDQTDQWKRYDALAEDALRLDSQLRQVMETSEARIRRDFTLFEEEQQQEHGRVSAALAEKENALKAQMTALEEEFNLLKKRAYDNVSENLDIFEDKFFEDLKNRSTNIDSRLGEWHTNFERKLIALNEESETERHTMEVSFKEETNRRIEEQRERILSELEHLKRETDAFKDKTHNDMDGIESRVSGLSSGTDDVRRELKEFSSQTRLFEQTDELKINLERSIETLRAERSRVEERRDEVAQMEAEFIKIRRLEDEVNAKMTRFLTEKNHLDAMEKDFDRLIQTSLRVEERLKEVTGADDTLQNIQVSLRKLEDAVVAAEDKYQRIESKNRILEETNRGIEKNYEMMEETEKALRKFRENIDQAENELDSFRPSIEELAAASEKARDTKEKLELLDTNLAAIENRIEKMQTAREWLARTETRFEELNREAQGELKLLETVLKDESRKNPEAGKGAPPISVRETVIRLRRQGWETEAIARNLKISRGEVELILEMGSRD